MNLKMFRHLVSESVLIKRLLKRQLIIKPNLSNRCQSTAAVTNPSLKDFLKPREKNPVETLCSCDDPLKLSKCSKSEKCQYRVENVPVFIKTYGCQMNLNDSDIVASILQDFGYRIVSEESEAEIQLLMTCAIRESSEAKIWGKVLQLRSLKNDANHPLKIVGILGCMAEHLKDKVFKSSVDIVAGPDAYRDLPRLFAVNKLARHKAINCLLSFDETYSDIRPVTNVNDVTSFVSITRGCDNLCSYCIVPFTRGKERSRPLPTIVDEVKTLMDRGIREVTLLGQNVNSYRDLATTPTDIGRDDLIDRVKDKESFAEGFKTVYRPRLKGITFDVLLEEIARISPELRVRFTSPHPKDFNDDVIRVIAKYPNIGRGIHLPAQSGSDFILDKMRRGYTKEAYLELVNKMRAAIPDVQFTSDFISGFCGESITDHRDTIDLIEKVRYSYIYAFPYSMRDKTHAYHRMTDDVDQMTKKKRVAEILDLFRQQATEINSGYAGTTQLILVEKRSRRNQENWMGRTITNIKTIFAPKEVPDLTSSQAKARPIERGDYVECLIKETNSQTLYAEPLSITTQHEFNNR